MRVEDILHDSRYMWVLVDTVVGAPVLVCRTVEEAVNLTLGGNRYLISPVRIYEKEEKGEAN
ncbi:MAG: hypothetical protein IJN42_01875 [Clostridia bacterium]|nr:hypothetical protein [Clostridia bacterium]